MTICLLLRSKDDAESRKLLSALSTIEKRFDYLCKVFTDDHEAVLDKMDYQKFLLTNYWNIIRLYLTELRGKRCEDCGSPGPLQVHHDNYDNHGREHEHLEDLRVLCRGCHVVLHLNTGVSDIIMRLLATRSRQTVLPGPVINPHYDPQVMIDHRRYGDIRGRISEQAEIG
jgi:5-methylcytosine-specific restriction endonuclease McrA